MSKAVQTKLNIELSDKLASFLITQPSVLKKYSGYSYVVFSYKNTALNKLNNSLLEELLQENSGVIKAVETGDEASPWVLTPVTA